MDKRHKHTADFDMGDFCKKPCRYRDGDEKKRTEADWQAKYDNLAYFFKDDKSNEQACKVKSEHMPGRLFRYKPLNSYALDELEDGYVYLNSATNFNDPFETTGMLSRGDFDELLEGREDGDNIKSCYKALMTEKEARKFLEKTVGEEGVFGSKQLEEQCALFQQKFLAGTEKLIDIQGSFLAKHAGIACFTDSEISLPMWGHYAGNHSGICIEYTFDRDFLAHCSGFFPMRYTNDFSKIHKSISAGYISACLYILSRKDESWRYEREWRYVDVLIGDGSERCRHFKVKAVYLGIRCSEDSDRILQIGKRRNFDVYKMVQTHYGLEARLIS